ncbi:tetratricopeptide repeat protein [bacterium]|nr:tetratricopeptide repeat protein [bacterium]
MTDPAPFETAQALLDKAQQALTDFQSEQAQLAAEKALQLLDVPDTDTELLAEAHRLCGIAKFERGYASVAEEHFATAQGLYDEIGDGRRATWCQVRIAYASHMRGDLRRSLHLASQALATAREHDWTDIEARALFTTGTVAWKRGDRQAAIGDFERAIALFTKHGMEDAVQRAYSSLAFVLIMDGQAEQGREILRHCLAYFEQAGDIGFAAKTMSNLAFVHYSLGELHEARDLLLRAIEINEDGMERHTAISIWYNLGLIEIHLGRRTEAKKCFLRARQLASQMGDDPVSEHMSTAYLGVLKLYNNEPLEALNLFELAKHNLAGTEGDEVELIEYFYALGCLVSAREHEFRQVLKALQPVARLMDCRDDFSMIMDMLDYITSEEYAPRQPLSAIARELAADWRSKLSAALPADTATS